MNTRKTSAVSVAGAALLLLAIVFGFCIGHRKAGWTLPWRQSLQSDYEAYCRAHKVELP